VSGNGQAGNKRRTGSPYMDKGRLRAGVGEAAELLSLSSNQLRIMREWLSGYCDLNGKLFRLGLVNDV